MNNKTAIQVLFLVLNFTFVSAQVKMTRDEHGIIKLKDRSAKKTIWRSPFFNDIQFEKEKLHGVVHYYVKFFIMAEHLKGRKAPSKGLFILFNDGTTWQDTSAVYTIDTSKFLNTLEFKYRLKEFLTPDSTLYKDLTAHTILSYRMDEILFIMEYNQTEDDLRKAGFSGEDISLFLDHRKAYNQLRGSSEKFMNGLKSKYLPPLGSIEELAEKNKQTVDYVTYVWKAK